MITIRLIAPDQRVRELRCATGQSLMKAAVDAGVDQIAADCGGTLTCATCHVMVDEAWAERLPTASRDEVDMLDFAAAPLTPTSRLSCQIQLTPELDGLVVHLPTTQY